MARTAEELLEDIRKLPAADQFRMAADLLEAKRPRLALAVASVVVDELKILHMAGRLGEQ